MTRTASVVTAVTPADRPPKWATLQRDLFDLLDQGRRRFEELYCAPDGSLVFNGRTHGRDGVDDFYEPFFNWPMLYLLGGADDLLDACKHHWSGVTRQLTHRGLLTKEFENGYDWFHQGESLLLFYGICAADPGDEQFAGRAHRFADLFLGDSPAGNYDTHRRMMRAPHIGALGPRPGLGEDRPYEAANTAMRKYGLPMRDIDGITTWDDLADPAKARLMADEMNRRLGTGDVPLNLAVTSLVTNAWLYDHDQRYADFVESYVDAWAQRTAANAGLIPDNVGPNGQVGELHAGHWYGGHYGWSWPHGLYSVVAPALIAAVNTTLITGDDAALSLPRNAVHAALEQARVSTMDPVDAAFHDHWHDRLGSDIDRELLLVPYRYDDTGWFDYQPLPPAYPAWLWWLTHDAADHALLHGLAVGSGYDWQQVRDFREKEEAGHEPPWLGFLAGTNPHYPENALTMAIGQVRRQMRLMEANPTPPPGDDIHWWQRLNPVVTEILTQLIAGAPQMLYNGGLPLTQLRWADAVRGRPGLPDGVAALVRTIGKSELTLELVNLHQLSRTLTVTGGGYGEHPITAVTADDGTEQPVTGRLRIHLPPRTRIRLRLRFTRRGQRARHQRTGV
ncbi:hypothetical protein [Actinocrispum sp. NPDC049592]|uniref:hypothetical protein n=1 Tax=Actinocrispum sp. NPDC049592 TaxID=3154835 RepID=UPI00342FF31C